MFNPYEPGAFERERARLERLPESLLRQGILRQLARLEADPDFRASWWKARRTQQWLFDTYGAEEIAHPPSVVQAKLSGRRN